LSGAYALRDADIARRVARELRELPRRVALDEFAAHAGREAHTLAFDLRPGLAKDIENLGVLAELEARFFEDAVGVALDDREARFVEQFEPRNLAYDVRRGGPATGGARGALGIAGARAAGARGGCRQVGHGQRSLVGGLVVQ